MNNSKFTSEELRQDPGLLRNSYPTSGKWDMPIIKKSEVDITGVKLIRADHIRRKDNRAVADKTVHFFVEDNKLDRYYDNPENYRLRLAQYAHVLTPDYSLYIDMPLSIQIYNTFRSRYCGADWQDYGLSVIPTVSWSTSESYDFCFDGIELGSVVAVSTVGGLRNNKLSKEEFKKLFLEGYWEMKRRINPRQVLCYGTAFCEMGEEVISVPYFETIRRGK
ncbi:hypothetical protein SDC9_09372 [bioreactor metagenome]|uniref:DUF4417 domain-containing protein n=1 Tax=bioreactor metagenome TaxID=1076179 RepID=A0A644TCZ3_9ZZZZ|nr:DUF4417 domain-containing protein [Desulfitobacterium hafniense]MEA5024262.1 DUF4417 domain-containing protein [Desulfitobacterium hafniense]